MRKKAQKTNKSLYLKSSSGMERIKLAQAAMDLFCECKVLKDEEITTEEGGLGTGAGAKT